MKFKKAFVPALVRKGYSLNDVAQWLGIGIGAVVRRVAQNGDFSRSEMQMIINKMGLTAAEAMGLFFEGDEEDV
jgi:hypothetical protein